MLLLIVCDMLSDAELTELRSFWMWDPLKEKWDFIRDWEEHKVEEYVFGRGGGLGQKEKGIFHSADGFSEDAPLPEPYAVKRRVCVLCVNPAICAVCAACAVRGFNNLHRMNGGCGFESHPLRQPIITSFS